MISREPSPLTRSVGTWTVAPHQANPSDDADGGTTAKSLKRYASDGDLPKTLGLAIYDKRMRFFVEGSATEPQGSDQDKPTLSPSVVMINLDHAEKSPNAKPDAFSTHESTTILFEGVEHYLKCNGHSHRATFMEVITAMIDRDWLQPEGLAPNVRFASNLEKFIPKKAGSVGIASEMVKGYCDWGTFVVGTRKEVTREEDDTQGEGPHEESTRKAVRLELDKPPKALKFLKEGSKETDYQDLLKEHLKIENQLKELQATTRLTMMKDGKLVEYAFDEKTTNLKEITVEMARKLAPINELERKRVHLQDKMFEMLRPEFKRGSRGVVKLHFQSEAICNKDVGNHKRDNSGPDTDDDDDENELFGFVAVDYGVTGDNGFEGKTMAESLEAFRVPARLNDPFLMFSEEILNPKHKNARRPDEIVHLSEGYLPGQVIDERITDFTYVSPTASLLGSLPRVAVVGGVMAEVVREFRENGKKPDEMLEVAFNVDMVKRDDLLMTIKRACRMCEENGHPIVMEMLAENKRIIVGNENCTLDELAEAIADKFSGRFGNISKRAGTEDMTDWANTHMDEAIAISSRVDATRERLKAAQN